ncbi:MAG: choice-of-anchor L domain-containing protein [Chitinophagales bacterium]|nr:choice-of-anchor L domain-containing protein [Chitinophagales bacterium]MDW8418463.1 choice-of-anchor L domain-containing protein [Chitinophagales bacterium]
MRKLFTPVLALAPIFLSAQLKIDRSVNWQQYLSNLMGGECVSIDSVTYHGNPASFSYFEDTTNTFGISRGIVISTGIADTNISLPAAYFSSSVLFTQGDQYLNTILNAQGGPMWYYTYDAVSIDFNFTSPILDTVFVKYIFASEEYPEYTCTQYNDLFAFLVIDPTTGSVTNVATIPGTPFPVSINNVNDNPACSISPQHYVDNQAGNLLCFDGYTVPLHATFVAQPGVTYRLRIVIADAGDDIYDSAVFLEIQSGIQQVAGHAKYQGASAQGGIVELFGFNMDSTLANPAGTAAIQPNGNFVFNNVPFGTYIVKTTLDTTLHPGAVPTYYNQAFLWSDATTINLSCDSLAYNFSAMQLLPTNGNGTISGTLYSSSGSFKNDTVNGFATNVSVWLADANTKTPVVYTRSNQNGQYQFSQIPDGTYKIYVDLPVLPMDSVREVTVANGSYSHSQLDYLVTPTLIKVYKHEVLTGVNGAIEDITAYPNPASEVLNIAASERIREVFLYDINGRLLLHEYVNDVRFTLPLQGIDNGWYLIRLVGETNTGHLKFTIHK